MIALEGITMEMIAIVVIVVSVMAWKWWQERDVPPGPRGLPVVGYLPFVGDKPELTFTHLGKKYGSIFSVRLGQRLMVVLNDFTAIKEALMKQGNVFVARPPGFAMATHDDEKGLLNDKGESYIRNRRFLINTLRDFGMGKTSLEPAIIEEVQKCLDTIAKSNGHPVDPQIPLSLMTANIICTLLFGKPFKYDDPRLKVLLRMPARFIEISGTLAIRQFFPILKLLPFGNVLSKQSNLEEIKKTYDKFHLDIIKEHKQNNTDEIRDYIDAYLSQEKKAGVGSEIPIDLEYLAATLEALFIGGSETVASTMRWAMLYLISHPEVQTKVQEEIDRVIGRERPPSMNDQQHMNYTRATMMELHRIISLGPLGVVRGNMEEVNILGYRIPKGSYVVPNIWAVHYDEKLFDDPTSFKPERFLDENGNVKKCDYLIPFSIGKRACVGETIARMELFLIFTSFLQRFTLQPDNYDPRTFEYLSGNARIPYPFTVRVVERKNYNLYQN